MTYPTGAPGDDPRQQPFGPTDPESGAVEYPPIEYNPTPPPGYSLPPSPAHPGYGPPPNYGPPPGYAPPQNYGAPPQNYGAPPQNYGPPPGVYGPPPGAYPPPGVYGQPPGYGAPYGQPTTNGMAIGSLVCGLVSLPGYVLCIGFPLGIIAVVLGIVALNQIDPAAGQKGKEMAIAGIAIGGLGLVGLGALFVFGSLPTL